MFRRGPLPMAECSDPVKNTGLGCHALLQGIFPTQRSNTTLKTSWISPYSQKLKIEAMEGEKYFIKLLSNLFGEREQIFPKLPFIHGTCDPI